MRVELRPCALPGLIEDAIAAMRPAAESKGVRIETRLEPELRPPLQRHVHPLRQVEGGDQALAQGPAEVALEDGEAAVRGGGLGAGVARGEVAVQVGLAGGRQPAAALRQPALVQLQVAPVGGQRVAREPLLEPEGVDEGVDGFAHGRPIVTPV